MTKYIELDWKVPVDPSLLDGATCDRWTEDNKDKEVEIETDCKFKVDEDGFFVSWKSPNREGEVIDLSTVSDVRKGYVPEDAKFLSLLQRRHGDELREKSFAICSSMDMVSVSLCHVICKSKEIALKWRQGLMKLINNNKKNNTCPRVNLIKHWKRILLTTTVDGRVSVKAIAKTFASGKTLKVVYEKLALLGLPSGKNDSMDVEALTFHKFYDLYKTICPRTDIDNLFKTITSSGAISLDKLVTWMNEHQRDSRLNEILYPPYDQKRCREIIEKYEKDPELREKVELSKEGLTSYMLSDENAPVILDRLDQYQEMDQPLCHYYINSSHNSYLTGRQVGGKSSVEIYRQILLSGCRCVELDCWDGKAEDEGEVIITHGKAMCTKVYFKDVIEAIRDTAFVTSDFPVILSFENHCNLNNQLRMAKYCIEIFGDLLLKEPLQDHQLVEGISMPSPDKLRRKILIKNKRLPPDIEKAELDLFLKGQLEVGSEEPSEDIGSSSLRSVDESIDLDAVAAIAVASHVGSTTNVHPLLSSIVNYVQSTRFQGFDEAEAKNVTHQMSSFGEPVALGYLKSQAIEFVNYNKRQFSRVYPKGARVDSSNFMPQIFWNAGCQLVALNFQTVDLPMQLNQAKFEYNGNCGYLLKPGFMRKTDKIFDPFAETPVDGVIAAQCKVQVIAGQFLSQKREGTYVEVDMYGLPTDTIKKEFRTCVVPANGLNPFYNEEPFHFRKVVLPELAVLRFGVYNEDGKLLGQRILPFDDLQMGYRHIALKTEGNYPMTLPMLFCNIELKIYVPDGLGDFMDALSDPRAFLSAQEKRAEQMRALGIDENDISGDVIQSKGRHRKTTVGAGDNTRKVGINGKSKEHPEFKLVPITFENLQDKTIAKLNKKHFKELQVIQKRHKKEKEIVMFRQCKDIEKLAKPNKDPREDPQIMALVREQTKLWTELTKRHRKDKWDLLASQMAEQEIYIKKAFEKAKSKQIKELECHFEKEKKEMMSSEARISIECCKEIQSDPTLRTKLERESRLKEKKEINNKRFLEDRKKATVRQEKRMAAAKAEHEAQMAEISRKMSETIESYRIAQEEDRCEGREESYV